MWTNSSQEILQPSLKAENQSSTPGFTGFLQQPADQGNTSEQTCPENNVLQY